MPDCGYIDCARIERERNKLQTLMDEIDYICRNDGGESSVELVKQIQRILEKNKELLP